MLHANTDFPCACHKLPKPLLLSTFDIFSNYKCWPQEEVNKKAGFKIFEILGAYKYQSVRMRMHSLLTFWFSLLVCGVVFICYATMNTLSTYILLENTPVDCKMRIYSLNRENVSIRRQFLRLGNMEQFEHTFGGILDQNWINLFASTNYFINVCFSHHSFIHWIEIHLHHRDTQRTICSLEIITIRCFCLTVCCVTGYSVKIKLCCFYFSNCTRKCNVVINEWWCHEPAMLSISNGLKLM